MNADAFDELVSRADPAAVVVTTVAEGELSGCLVGFHAQSGIDPPSYCIWLSKANHTYRVALRSELLAVHFLTSDDVAMAKRFGTVSGEDTDKFEGLALDPQAQGVPLLSACPNRMLVQRTALLDEGGDHVCLTTRVLEAQFSGDYEPLRVSEVVHLEPGRESEERSVEP